MSTSISLPKSTSKSKLTKRKRLLSELSTISTSISTKSSKTTILPIDSRHDSTSIVYETIPSSIMSSPQIDSNVFMNISACSYEGSLFGWKLKWKEELVQIENELVFAFNVIQGSLRTMAISSKGKYLACSGVDERIRIFNVKEMKSVCDLIQHTKDVTQLQFFEESFLLSCSEDMSICIWRINDWTCVHRMEGHREAIFSISIHPSGKLCLSVSRDKTMRMWNLVSGTCAFTHKLKSNFHQVKWNEDGSAYLLIGISCLEVYLTEHNELTGQICSQMKVNGACFVHLGESVQDYSGHLNTRTTIATSSFSSRIAVILDSVSISFYDIHGAILSTLNLNSLNCGRLRDIVSCVPNYNVLKKMGGDNHEDFSDIGESMIVATSLGHVIVVNAKASCEQHDLEACIQAHIITKAEPRFTCVTAWSD